MIISSLQLVARRSLSHWRLLLAVIVGVLLAVTIMASSIVYFDSLRDLGLTRDLEAENPRALDVLIESEESPLDPTTFQRHYATVQSQIDARMGGFASEVSFGFKSDTFYYAGAQSDEFQDRPAIPPVSSDNRRLFFASLRGLDDHAALVEGTWPRVPAAGRQPASLAVEVIVSEAAAAAFDLKVGALVYAVPYWEDRHSSVVAEIVGIFRPDDPSLPYWRLYEEGFGVGSPSFVFGALMVPEETLVSSIGPFLPKMGGEYFWLVDTDPGAIHAADAPGIRGAVLGMEAELRANIDGYRHLTELPDVLDRFGTRLFFNRLPMFVVLILIVLVVVYYVLTIASLLVDAQRAEIALLRSRGATSTQIIVVHSIEAFALAAAAFAIGPLLAAAGVSLIGAVPLFSDLNDGHLLPVRLTWSVYRMAGIGALLSLAALLIPSLRAARIGLLQFRQGAARPPRLPAFQRYYLDLALLGIVLFFFWQLSKQGSFVAVRLLGEVVVDQLILAVPAMSLVAAGIVLLRLFPLAMDGLGRLLSSRWLSRVTSPALVLGLWQMARNPAHHARLSLLLILTAGLGVFAASFGTTLQRSSSDRVHYETGSELRVTGVGPARRGFSVNPYTTIAAAPGVELASPVIRVTGSVLSQESAGGVQLVGIDPRTFTDVAWSRPDLTGDSWESVASAIDSFNAAGIELPEDAEWISVRLRPAARRSDVNVVTRVSDRDGRFYTYVLGSLSPASNAGTVFPCEGGEESAPIPWCRLGADLRRQSPQIQSVVPQPPLRLEAIGVTVADPRRGRTIRAGAFEIDDVSVVLHDGRAVAIDDFSEPARWGVLVEAEDAVSDTYEVAKDRAGRQQPGTVRFAWSSGTVGRLRGISPGGEPPPVPAFVSPSFIEYAKYEIGDVVDLSILQEDVSIRVAGVVSYFPTVDPNLGPFVVVDGRALSRAASVGRVGEELGANELWLNIDETRTDTERLRGYMVAFPFSFGEIIERQARLDAIAIDPLVSAGWRALLGIAFFTVLIVSAVGFIVHAQVTFRTRQTELALLRAVGLSMKQMLALVLLEQLLVIGAALAIGAFMGARLGATIMPYLGTSGAGLRVVPPMVVQIDWGAVGITFGIVAAVFAIVVGAILASVYRMSVHRVLRLGER
ncbi:MAG: FtsX-like permease family protein [Chloroflexi bacterium]|nr:FtsX-like permease family protein [Chloroflexota bacterium]